MSKMQQARPDFSHSEFIRSRLDAAGTAETCPTLKVVGVYEDLLAHTLAARLLQSVSRNCANVCKVNSAWWSFDTLASVSVLEAAARAAAEADMIWCSTHACEHLTDKVRAWVDAWSESRNESDVALVALLRCPPNYRVERSPARAYLSQAAKAVGMEFFVHRFDCACSTSHKQPLSAPLVIRSQIDEYHPNRQQVRHWGINE